VISGLYSTRPDIFAQLSTIDNTSPSITQDITTVIDSSNLDNPIRQGSRFGIENPTNPTNSAINVIKTNIQNFWQAQNITLWLIQNIINILLSFTTLIIVVYLIYEWYMVVIAGTDEWQYKKALTKLKNAAIAIAGIAVSWFIVSFIFAALHTIIS
jgi:Type IV secretion system pilin